MIKAFLITDDADIQAAFNVRKIVFVDEQQVGENDEFDEFENECRHFIAKIDDKPVGAARWRTTPNGIKLERFAVLKEYRSSGVGAALLNAVIADIKEQDSEMKGKCYLHAQLEAIPFYSKFGFTAIGEEFDECNIMHRKMVY